MMTTEEEIGLVSRLNLGTGEAYAVLSRGGAVLAVGAAAREADHIRVSILPGRAGATFIETEFEPGRAPDDSALHRALAHVVGLLDDYRRETEGG